MGNTVFHKIMSGELDAEKLHEDEHCIVIADIAPVAEHHYLIVPKKDLPKVSDADQEDQELLGHLMLVGNKIAREKNLVEDGFRLVVNNGESAGQTVFQLHIHLLAGREFSWPPG